MVDRLRVYIGYQTGLVVGQYKSESFHATGEFFSGGVVDSITGCRQNPEVVFAGVAFDGLYRTQNGGQDWKKVFAGDVRAVAVDSSDEHVIYTGTGPIRLFRSEDGGDSWHPLDSLLQLPEDVKTKWQFPVPPHPAHVRNIFIHPENSNLLMLALEHGGIVRSLNRGETWEDVSEGISYPDMHVVAHYPGAKDRYFASSARGFFRTEDPPLGWRRAETGMPWGYSEMRSYSHDWVALPGDPPTMFLAGANGSPAFWDRPTGAEGIILRSNDGGENWHQVFPGRRGGMPEKLPWMTWALVWHPVDANTVFAGMGDVARGYTAGPRGSGALFLSPDRGDSWQPAALNVPAIRVLWVAP
jgi:photosystem II stability/assembly factor-like uncharacterized protein